MHTVYLALGSNVGDRAGNLARAVDLLARHMTIVRRAPVYETKPVGPTPDQGNFLNSVLEAMTDLLPRELLAVTQKTERELDRTPTHKWGPREIDIDILFYDQLAYTDATLQIPHPMLPVRDFVLVPLAEIAPLLVHPVFQKSITELLEVLPEAERSVIAKTAF